GVNASGPPARGGLRGTPGAGPTRDVDDPLSQAVDLLDGEVVGVPVEQVAEKLLDYLIRYPWGAEPRLDLARAQVWRLNLAQRLDVGLEARIGLRRRLGRLQFGPHVARQV